MNFCCTVYQIIWLSLKGFNLILYLQGTACIQSSNKWYRPFMCIQEPDKCNCMHYAGHCNSIHWQVYNDQNKKEIKNCYWIKHSCQENNNNNKKKSCLPRC